MEPNSPSDGSSDSEYPGVWNDTVHSPYLKPVRLSPSGDVTPGSQHPHTFDLPLSPPFTPPNTTIQLTISPLQTLLSLPFHQDDTLTPSTSASPPNVTITVPTIPAVQSAEVSPTSVSDDYTDGGPVSNMAALPILCTYVSMQFSWPLVTP